MVQDFGSFNEIISHGLDPSELLKSKKEEHCVKTPTLDRLTSIKSAVEMPVGEAFVHGSTMDLRGVQESDVLSIHPTESMLELDRV